MAAAAQDLLNMTVGEQFADNTSDFMSNALNSTSIKDAMDSDFNLLDNWDPTADQDAAAVMGQLDSDFMSNALNSTSIKDAMDSDFSLLDNWDPTADQDAAAIMG